MILSASAASASAQADEHARAQRMERPASVPQIYVSTPNGYFHPTCVVEVADDEHVAADGTIRSANGKKRSIPKCLYDRYDRHGKLIAKGKLASRAQLDKRTSDAAASPAPEASGWIAHATHNGSTPMSYIAAKWVVPSNPIAPNNETLVYFFPGLQGAEASEEVILQPVLRWWQGAWAIASWKCCYQGVQVHSPYKPVSAGNTITGYINGTNCNATTGKCANWVVDTRSSNGQVTTLNTTTAGFYDMVTGGVLEVYSIGTCAELPASGNIDFTGIAVRSVAGATTLPPWSAVMSTGQMDCVTNVSWTGNKVSLGWSPSQPAAIEKSNGEINVFYPGTENNRLLHMLSIPAGSTVGTDTTLCTARSIRGRASAVQTTFTSATNTAGSIRVYYNDQVTQTLNECGYNPTTGAWSNWNSGLKMGDSPSAVEDPVAGTVHIYFHDQAKNLRELTLDATGWKVKTLVASNVTGNRLVMGTPAAMIKANGSMHVAYANDTTGNVHLMARPRGSTTWTDSNLAQKITNSPSILESNVVTATNPAGTVRIYYRGNDSVGTLRELSWSPNGSSWLMYNTYRTMRNQAFAVQDKAGNVLIHYDDTGRNPPLLEEFYLDGSGWHINESGTNEVGAKHQMYGSVATIAKKNGGAAVFFRTSVDGKLRMAYRTATSGWAGVSYGLMAP